MVPQHKMRRITCTIIALLTVGVCHVAGESLMASISMGGVRANLKFNALSSDVTCTLEDGAVNFPVAVTVAIHPVWVDYDVKDKCSNSQLGNPIAGKTGSLDNSGSKTFTLALTTLDYLEGKSVVLTANNEYYCGTILKDGHYMTAVAVFKSKALGSIYFRQQEGSSDEQTIVVSKLKSSGSFTKPIWKITDDATSCNDVQSLAGTAIFNPVASKAPAVGNLNSKGFVPSLNGIKQAFQVSDLPLTGGSSIVEKHIVVYDGDQNSMAACAKIRVFHTRKATVLFSHQGIHGHITFMQASPLDKTHVNIMMEGLNNGANGYHVHLYPVPTQTEKGQTLCSNAIVAGHFDPYLKASTNFYPDPTDGTDDQYEVGDLSSKYGTLRGLGELSKNYSDWNLPMFGKNSIVGRSLVIHRNDSLNTRWVCSNIQLEGAVTVGVAMFKYPAYGYVYFTQATDMPYSDTWIFASLRYLDDTTSSSVHKWLINNMKVGDDMMSSGTSRCSSTGMAYDPFNGKACTSTDLSMECKLGDLAGKVGEISIGNNTMAKAYYTDALLPLSGSESILGKSVVIMDSVKSDKLACATIQHLHGSSLKANFDSGGISGYVSFMQMPGYGQRPTMVNVMLSGFDSKKQMLQIHALPPADDGSCSNLGSIYDPLDFSGAKGSTQDQYKLGDLSRGDAKWKDLNLPLSGSTSIRNRSLAVVDKQSNVVSCAILQFLFSKDFKGYLVSAKAVFTKPLTGYIKLTQTLYDDGSMSDTTVLVNLKNADGTKTQNHNWHTHEKHVFGDSAATTGRCSSTGPHYDPFMAQKGNAVTNYAKQCSPMYLLRCELGDQANKLGTYSLGDGMKVFTDVDLPLNGMYHVQGRSFVVHVANKGAARYSCADINPISHLDVTVKFKTPTNLDLAKCANIYATACKVDPNDVVIEYVSTSEDMTTVRVHFIGLHRNMVRGKFLSFFGKEENRESLSMYAPTNDPNRACVASISTILLLMTFLANAILY